MARYGPVISQRDRHRISLGAGKIDKKLPDGTHIKLDIDPLWLVVADGVAAGALAILEEARQNAPDDPKTPGSRIRDNGDIGVYAFGKQLTVEGSSAKGRKPRRFQPPRDGVAAYVTFRSRLHHLHELGTVNMPARPYLGPARLRVAHQVPGIIRDHFPK